MFSTISRRLALAAAGMSILGGAASAAGPAYVNQSSSPVYWGTTGTTAVMILRYDNSATLPLNVTNLQIGDLNGNNLTQALYNCGSIIKQGDTFVGHQLTPGEDCYLTAPNTGADVIGTATLTDGTASNANVSMYVRTSIEIRDANGTVLSHVEVR